MMTAPETVEMMLVIVDANDSETDTENNSQSYNELLKIQK